MKLAMRDSGLIDLSLGARGLELEGNLETAVIVSLLTDRRANTDDRLPDSENNAGPVPADRRGWCGDALSEIDGDRIGSRLWLLSREKQTEETRRRAVDYAREALRWLIDDGHVRSVAVEAEWSARGRLDMKVVLTLPEGGQFTTSVPGVTGGAYAV